MQRQTEQVDVVVVGARPAGSATAIALARRGKRVVALDRASFPSDTLSTHLLFAGCVAEFKRSGALERLLATGAPKLPYTQISGAGFHPRGAYTPVEGIDYGLCVRRPGMDLALVETAREAGADVRERCTVTQVLWAGGRAAGVVYRDPDGEEREIRAKLVVGADGRRSQMADMLGAQTYRTAENGRGLAFHYLRDPAVADPDGPVKRDAIIQWRVGDTLGMWFPTDQDGGLALFMPPKEDISRFRKDPEGMWEHKLSLNEPLRRRLEGCEKEGPLRSTADTQAFFRVSSGPGWALVGDAGHFKDPVVAQGIRDALRFGRRLGEVAAEALDHPRWLDRRLYAWELERDAECIPTFYLGRKHTRIHPPNQLETEFYRQAAKDQDLADEVADVFARTRMPHHVFHPGRQVRWFLRAFFRRGADRVALVGEALDDVRLDLQMHRDLAALRAGRRAGAGRWNRWGRGGWSPSVAFGASGDGTPAVSAQRPVSLGATVTPPAPPAADPPRRRAARAKRPAEPAAA
ncbi:NAD(P)/FAD-dependent oxidoreductase [Conexibacter sp. SYSU D00693]|uniref:NAD(P)/FAD-dependent oxidoreductase n=1 Tax=Conexibacter sp. SYSU D00693 TaxID=2812560 RepID=UPI00196B47A2|nr:NAD(P)/FAD-dependent oxidoreductase [Conexibacter sp. SYSU D00693]